MLSLVVNVTFAIYSYMKMFCVFIIFTILGSVGPNFISVQEDFHLLYEAPCCTHSAELFPTEELVWIGQGKKYGILTHVSRRGISCPYVGRLVGQFPTFPLVNL